MNKRQTNQKEMFDSVDLFLDSNMAKWSAIPKIVSLKSQFSALLPAITLAATDQDKAKTYLGKNKSQLKKVVADSANIINDTIEAMARQTGNAVLTRRMNVSATELFRLRNVDFMIKVQEIIAEADKYATVLSTEYGLPTTEVDKLKADIDLFAEMNGLPRAYQVAAHQASQELASLIEQTNKLLTNGLDKLMSVFRHSDPTFYAGYHSARKIIDN